MTSVLYRKLLYDVRIFLAVICLLMLTFEMLWAHVTWRITADILQKLTEVKDITADDISRLIFSGSGATLQALIGGKNIRIDRAQHMMSVGFMEPAVLIILSIWAVGRSAAAIAGEIDRGTMELLLAQPIRRSQVILAHVLLDLTAVPLICLSTWGGMWLGTYLVGLQHQDMDRNLRVDPQLYVPGLFCVALLVLAINGYTLLLSAAGRFRSKVLGLAMVITLVQFLVNVIGQLWVPLEWARPFTVFYHYQPQPIVLYGDWSFRTWQHLGTLFGVAAGGYLLAWWVFCKRDLPAPL